MQVAPYRKASLDELLERLPEALQPFLVGRFEEHETRADGRETLCRVILACFELDGRLDVVRAGSRDILGTRWLSGWFGRHGRRHPFTDWDRARRAELASDRKQLQAQMRTLRDWGVFARIQSEREFHRLERVEIPGCEPFEAKVRRVYRSRAVVWGAWSPLPLPGEDLRRLLQGSHPRRGDLRIQARQPVRVANPEPGEQPYTTALQLTSLGEFRVLTEDAQALRGILGELSLPPSGASTAVQRRGRALRPHREPGRPSDDHERDLQLAEPRCFAAVHSSGSAKREVPSLSTGTRPVRTRPEGTPMPTDERTKLASMAPMLLKRALGERLEASKYKQAGRDWVLEVYDTYGLAVTRHALEESLPAWTASLRRPKPDGSKGIERPGFQLVSMLEKRKDVDCPLERVFKDRGVEILEACGVELEDPFAEVREEARGKEEEGYRAWLEAVAGEPARDYANAITDRKERPRMETSDAETLIGRARSVEKGDEWNPGPDKIERYAREVYREHLTRQREGERWAALPSAAERMAGMIQASSEAKRRGITIPRTEAQEATQ